MSVNDVRNHGSSNDLIDQNKTMCESVSIWAETRVKTVTCRSVRFRLKNKRKMEKQKSIERLSVCEPHKSNMRKRMTTLTSARAKLMMLRSVYSSSDPTPINPKRHASRLISEQQQMMMSDRNRQEDTYFQTSPSSSLKEQKRNSSQIGQSRRRKEVRVQDWTETWSDRERTGNKNGWNIAQLEMILRSHW